MKNDKFTEIKFNIKKNQKHLIAYLFSINKNIENINVVDEYYKYTNCKSELSNNEISKIKSKILGSFRGLNIFECLHKINLNDIRIEIKEKI